MSKKTEKPISTDAANFLAFLRNKKTTENSEEKKIPEKIIEEEPNVNAEIVQQVYDHDMQSESIMEAEELFDNLVPDSPEIAVPKSSNKKPNKKENITKKVVDKKNEEEKIQQTKSILRKGRVAEEENKEMEEEEEEKPEKESKQIEEPKKKSVSFEGMLPLSVDLEKRWKDPIENQRKGKFDKEEEKILSEAVGKFLVVNDISLEEFEGLLTLGERSDKISKRQKVFSLLSTALPNRSPESCYKYLKRNFNSLNRKGKWTEEEVDKLKLLVEKYGRKWTIISKELKRSSDNCYDKFRELGEDNMEDRVKGIWEFTEVVELLKLIEKMTKIKFLDKKIDQELDKANFHDSVDKEEVINKKYNSKNFIFHNNSVIKHYVNAKNFQKINISQIRWNEISTYLRKRNIHDCRNKIVQLLQIFFHNDHKDLEEKIVDFLILNKYQHEHEVNWKDWKSKDATPEEAKNRFMIMKKMIEGRSIKPFKTIILELKQRLEKKLKERPSTKEKKHHVVVEDLSDE